MGREEEGREGTRNSWDTTSELDRETGALAEWRRVEGFGERRRREAEEEQIEADWYCCGRSVRGRGRGGGGRGGRSRGRSDDIGLEEWQRARQDILTNRTYI